MMSTSDTAHKLQAKNIIRVVGVTAALLLIPFFLMQFDVPVTDPGNPVPDRITWNWFDFLVMGALMLTIGFSYELLALKAKDTVNKIILAIVLLGVFLLIWAELAVGIFGSPFAGN